jgi:hypothetical protein
MQKQNQVFRESTPANSPTSPDVVQSALIVSADAIRLCAYRNWEVAGKPSSDGIPFWLEAERELTAEKDLSGRGNSQDADRHSGIRHPHSLKM